MTEFLEDFESFSKSWWPYIISAMVSVISAIRIYVGGTYCTSHTRLDGKTVIVTGGSSGIGFEVAKELARRGGTIILAIRNAKKGLVAVEKIKQVEKNAQVIIKILDMSEFSSVRQFVDDIKKEYDKIDILINNAATISPEKTPEGNHLAIVTNYLSPFLLTHLLLPLLNKSEQGRVINVSAMAHLNATVSVECINGDQQMSEKEAFGSSKLALTIFTKHMSRLYKHTKVTFNSVNPGLVRNTKHMDKYTTLGRTFWTRFSVWPWVWLFMKTPQQGCQSILYLALEPTLSGVSGYYFSDCEIKEPADIVNDKRLAELLYVKSCKIVNIKPSNSLLEVPKENDGQVDEFEDANN